MAKFYVNRGGGRVPEGPFEEQQIVRLILAGKLRSGHVSEVGSQRFFPIESHPRFARALAEAGTAPVVVVPLQVKRPGTKNASRGLLLGAVLSIFGLALAAVAIGSYVMFSNGGMPARGAVPQDVELFFEVTSVPQTLAHLRNVRTLDADKLAGKRLLGDAAADLSSSFGISEAKADALILAATSVGIAGRKLSSAPEGGLFLTFSNASPMNTLLASKRFKYVALVARNGRKYQLSAEAPEPNANPSATRRTLAGLSLGTPATALFWFETSKVLFVGSQSFAESVARVLSLDVPSLQLSPAFQAAQRDVSGTPDAIGYLDPKKLTAVSDPRLTTLLGYAHGSGPVSASFLLMPAGLLTRFTGHIAGAAASQGALTTPALALSLSDRLPAETFAYATAVSKTLLSGAELQKLMLEQIASADPERADDVRAGIALIEQRLHVNFTELLSSIGDEGAVAVVAPQDYSLALGSPEQMLASFALVGVLALKDEAPLRSLLKQWKIELGPLASQYQIQEEADGYALTPNDKALGLSAQLRFTKGTLFVALGSSTLVERSWRAFSAGENTLASDAAHRAARAALPSSAQAVAWVDAARVISTVQKNPFLAPRVGHLGEGVLRLTGPNRLTAGFALSGEPESGGYRYRVDALNLPVFYEALGLDLP
jgi:hypothetical protein